MSPSDRTVREARERAQQSMDDVRRLVNQLGDELRELEVYGREMSSTSGPWKNDPGAREAYRDMADRVQKIQGES